MASTPDSDSSPRLLPVSRRVHRRGKDLERFLNLWRLALAGSLAAASAVGGVAGGAAHLDGTDGILAHGNVIAAGAGAHRELLALVRNHARESDIVARAR